MRTLLGLVLGCLIGATVAGVILFYNPMSQYEGKVPVGESLFYNNDMEHFAVSHSGRLPVPIRPRGIEPLWESAINGAVLTVFPLNNAEGEAVALASRVSMLSEESDLLLNGAKTHNDWLLSFAGQGTLFVDDREDLSELVRYGVVPVWLLRQPWTGSRELLSTSGPDAGSAKILGGTGEYKDAKGRLRQRHVIEQLGPGGIRWSSEVGLEITAENETVVNQR
jgi:hypothetical protein